MSLFAPTLLARLAVGKQAICSQKNLAPTWPAAYLGFSKLRLDQTGAKNEALDSLPPNFKCAIATGSG